MDLDLKLIPLLNKNEEKDELKNLLLDVKKINEIQKNILVLINDQDDNIKTIEDNSEQIVNLSEKANTDLEIASGYSFKLAPIAIGGSIGALLTLPFTISTSMSIIGYSLVGGGITGSVLGKYLS